MPNNRPTTQPFSIGHHFFLRDDRDFCCSARVHGLPSNVQTKNVSHHYNIKSTYIYHYLGFSSTDCLRASLPFTNSPQYSTAHYKQYSTEKPEPNLSFHAHIKYQRRYSVVKISSRPVWGSNTRSRPSGATPNGFTALLSSLISKGISQSTH